MLNIIRTYIVSPRYSPPPPGTRRRTPELRGGVISSITVRVTPKVNRRRELKARCAALRKWKRVARISGRLDSGAYSMFIALCYKANAKRPR